MNKKPLSINTKEIFDAVKEFNPEKFNPNQWEYYSQFQIHEGISPLDYNIFKVINSKEMLMFIPDPDNLNGYNTLKFINGNPFVSISKMKSRKEGIKFKEIKDILTLNITGKYGKIIILVPHPKKISVDIYTLGFNLKLPIEIIKQSKKILDTINSIEKI